MVDGPVLKNLPSLQENLIVVPTGKNEVLGDFAIVPSFGGVTDGH